MTATFLNSGRVARIAETLRAALTFVALLFVLPMVVVALLAMRSHKELFIPFYMVLIVVLAAVCWKRLPQSGFKVFCLYVLAFALFNGLRTYADNTGLPVNYNYPVDIDISLFGTTPTVWLQKQFFVPGQIGLIDRVAVIVYLSYFAAHFILAGYLLTYRRDMLLQHTGTIVAALFAGLALYFLLPTAPPWMAAQDGLVPHIFRITVDVTNDVSSNLYAHGAAVAGNNDVGAMPSLHTALTAVVAMTLWRLNRIAGVFGWLYVAVMGISLMYLGEHYFTDVAAGVLVAVASWHLVRHLIYNTAWRNALSVHHEVHRSLSPDLGVVTSQQQ